MTESGIALEARYVSKAFDGKPALKNASFSVNWGEVHALLGENGAGKSTIMNVATGIYSPDEGEIRINGSPEMIHSPAQATSLGIGMVHQHYRLVKRFTAAQNILLCCGSQLGISTTRQAAEIATSIANEIGFEINPHAVVGQMSIAEQQRTEITKVLLLGAKIVILDEPTAVLTDQESQAILAFTRRLAETNHAVVLITHKLREVTAYSDRVTVMRHGETVLSGADTAGLDVNALARHMVGEQIGKVKTVSRMPGDACLSVRDLAVPSHNGVANAEHISMDVRKGEILGIAGVGGNGQQQLADALTGLLPVSHGTIHLLGEDVTLASVSERRAYGLRAVPSDRFASGLVAAMSVAENLAMTTVPTGAFGHRLSLSKKKMTSNAEEAIAAHNIHGATPDRQARLLSGGNAQKLLLARELSEGSSLLVAHSPTRGLDVKACNAVHSAIQSSVESGLACLLISEDLEEILALSNRIAVMSRGRIVGEFPAKEATPEKLGALMMGHA